jgi:cytochrome b6-f complex iron-sulfur subunit
MKRRDFINKVAFGTLVSGGALLTSAALRIPFPQTGGAARRYALANINQYPFNHFTFLPGKNIYIYRDRRGIRAVSAICTHLGCVLRRSDNGFRCPCHGSRFNDRGEALSGPATSDLNWYAVRKDLDGRIVVIEDEIVSPEDFLKVEA